MLIALILACKNTPVATDPPVPSDCEADFVVESGAQLTSLDFTFEWSGEAQVSVGPTWVIQVPRDIVSFAATVDSPGQWTGLAWLEFDDQVWLDASLAEGPGAWYTAPYYHWGVSGGTVVAPIVPGNEPLGGCITIQPAALDDISGEGGTLHLLTRSGATEQPMLDINVGVVGDTVIDAATVDAAMAVASDLWSSGGGPTLGQVRTYAVSGPTFLPYDQSTSLRATELDPANTHALNLFFVQDYLEADGTLGEAGGIPGPVGLQGVDEAGVILSVDAHLTFAGDIDVQLLGEVIAHEAGHQFGLFHTTESDGSRSESLEDTPDCPPGADIDADEYFSAEECAEYDGRNFMFWVAGDFVQNEITADQGFVLGRSPVVY